MTSALHQAAQLLRTSRRTVAVTGAGVSAESGIPTFRGADGLWNNYRPEDLATVQAFKRDPELVWRWYNMRRSLIARAKPNAAHYALAALESALPDFTLITQNVDGLHAAAGSKRLYELHGNLWRVRCTRCLRRDENRALPVEFPPVCPSCDGLLRPDVVWFGENLDPVIVRNAWDAAQRCELLLLIGTSSVVFPAASLADVARNNEAHAALIEINLEHTERTQDCTIHLQGKAGEILPELLRLARE